MKRKDFNESETVVFYAHNYQQKKMACVCVMCVTILTLNQVVRLKSCLISKNKKKSDGCAIIFRDCFVVIVIACLYRFHIYFNCTGI